MYDLNTEKRKTHLRNESREKFETSMVVPLGILVDSVKRQIGKGYSKSGIYFWETFHEYFNYH